MPAIDNKWKGESSFEVAGKRYTMRLGFNTLAKLDDHANLGIPELMKRLGDPAAPGFMSLMILAVWAALQRHHPELTPEDVGDLIDEAGFDLVREAFANATGAGFPEKKEGDAAADADPQKADAGTGQG